MPNGTELNNYITNKINSLIKLNNSGVTIANMSEIINTITDIYKRIYGSDIDISTASADGQYSLAISLLINNILQLVYHMYSSLNPSQATGRILDILCSYSNIQRIGLSQSTAQLWLKNISNTEQTPTSLQFKDVNGNYWTWKNPVNITNKPIFTWKPNEILLITDVTCDEFGPIIALGTNKPYESEFAAGGDINSTIDYGTFLVYQQTDADIGNTEESDESLRARRTQSLGNKSTSILSGLRGSLLNVSGVKDCWIYNNITGAKVTLSDGEAVENHDIYICLRYDDSIILEHTDTTVDKDPIGQVVGNLIYNKLTPGVRTSSYSSLAPTGYSDVLYIQKTEELEYAVYWKVCIPEVPNVRITFACSSEYPLPNTPATAHNAQTDLEKQIVSYLQNYFDSVKIGQTMTSFDIISNMNKANYRTENTGVAFFVTDVKMGEKNESTYLAQLTYFKSSSSNYKFEYDISDLNKPICTLTIAEA